MGNKFRTGVTQIIEKYNLPYSINGIGSLSCLFFNKDSVVDYKTAKASDTNKFAQYFKLMLDKGNYFGASQFEAIFISAVHTQDNIEKTLYDMENTLVSL